MSNHNNSQRRNIERNTGRPKLEASRDGRSHALLVTETNKVPSDSTGTFHRQENQGTVRETAADEKRLVSYRRRNYENNEGCDDIRLNDEHDNCQDDGVCSFLTDQQRSEDEASKPTEEDDSRPTTCRLEWERGQTVSEWPAGKSQTGRGMKKSSSIPVLKGVSRKGSPRHDRPQTQACPLATTTTTSTALATPSKTTPPPPPYRPAGMSGSGAERRDTGRRIKIKTLHKQSSLQLDRSRFGYSSCVIKQTSQDFSVVVESETTPENSSHRCLPDFDSKHDGGGDCGRRGEQSDHSFTEDSIRRQAFSHELLAVACGIPDKLCVNCRAEIETAIRSDENAAYPTSAITVPTTSTTSFSVPREGISEPVRGGLTVRKAVSENASHGLHPDLGTHGPMSIDLLQPGLEYYGPSADIVDKRARNVDESGGHDIELASRTNRTGSVSKASSLLTALTNHPHGSLKAGNGLEGRGGNQPFTYTRCRSPTTTIASPKDILQPLNANAELQNPHDKDYDDRVPGVIIDRRGEYPADCLSHYVQSTACIVSPLETGLVSPLQPPLTRAASPKESKSAEGSGVPELPATTTDTLTSEDTVLGCGSSEAHDSAARQQSTLSAGCPAFPRCTVSNRTLTSTASAESRSSHNIYLYTTPARQPKRNVSPSQRCRSRKRNLDRGNTRCRSKQFVKLSNSSETKVEVNLNNDEKTQFLLYSSNRENKNTGHKPIIDNQSHQRPTHSDSESQDTEREEKKTGSTSPHVKTDHEIIVVDDTTKETVPTATCSPSQDGVTEWDNTDVSLHSDEDQAGVSVQSYDTRDEARPTIEHTAVISDNRWNTARTITTTIDPPLLAEAAGLPSEGCEIETTNAPITDISSIEAKSFTVESQSECYVELNPIHNKSKLCVDQTTDVTVSSHRRLSGKSTNGSCRSLIPKRKPETQTLDDTVSVGVRQTGVSVTRCIDSSASCRDGGITEDGVRCMDSEDCYYHTELYYKKESVLSGPPPPPPPPTLPNVTLAHPGYDDRKRAREDETVICLTRIQDPTHPGNSNRCVDDVVEGTMSEVVTHCDNELLASVRDSNREHEGTETVVVEDGHKGHDTSSSSSAANIKGHTNADADLGASVKAAIRTSPERGGPATSRKSKLMSPPSRKRSSSASKENVCVDKHGASKASGASSCDRTSASATTSGNNSSSSKTDARVATRGRASMASCSSSSPRNRQSVTKSAGNGETVLTSGRSSTSGSKLVEETMSRRSQIAQASSRTAPKVTKAISGRKTNSDVILSDVSAHTAKPATVLREATKQDRRSASPKQKQSKENENRKQKSASPQCAARSPRQDDSLPAVGTRSKKSQSPSPRECGLKQEGKPKAKELTEELKDPLLSPDKEKADSPTKEKADTCLDKLASKKIIKTTTSARTKAGLMSESTLKQQCLKLPRRSTETLSGAKTQKQTTTTSASNLQSTSSRTKLTSSVKITSSGTTSSSSGRPTLSTSRLDVKKASSPDSDISTTSDVPKTSGVSLVSSTSSTKLKGKESQSTGSNKPVTQTSKATAARCRSAGSVAKRSSLSSSKLVSVKQESSLALKKTLSPSSVSECSVSTRDSSVDSRLEDDAQSVVSSVSMRSTRSSSSSLIRSKPGLNKDVTKEKQTKPRVVTTTREAKSCAKPISIKNKSQPLTKSKTDERKKSPITLGDHVTDAHSETIPDEEGLLQNEWQSSNEGTAESLEGEELAANSPKRKKGSSQDVKSLKKTVDYAFKGSSPRSAADTRGTSASANVKLGTAKTTALSTMKQQRNNSQRETGLDTTHVGQSKQTARLSNTQSSLQQPQVKQRTSGALPLSKSDKGKPVEKGLQSARHSGKARETRSNSKQNKAAITSDDSETSHQARVQHEAESLSRFDSTSNNDCESSLLPLANTAEQLAAKNPHNRVTETEHPETSTQNCRPVERELINKTEPEIKRTIREERDDEEKGKRGVEEWETQQCREVGRETALTGGVTVKTSPKHFTRDISGDVIRLETRLRGDCSDNRHSVDKYLTSSNTPHTSPSPCQNSSVPVSDPDFYPMEKEIHSDIPCMATETDLSPSKTQYLSNSVSCDFDCSTLSPENASHRKDSEIERDTGTYARQHADKQFTSFREYDISPVMDSMISSPSDSQPVQILSAPVSLEKQQKMEGSFSEIKYNDETATDSNRQHEDGGEREVKYKEGQGSHSVTLASEEEEKARSLSSSAIKERGIDGPHSVAPSKGIDKKFLFTAQARQSGSDKQTSAARPNSRSGIISGRGVKLSSVDHTENLTQLVHHSFEADSANDGCHVAGQADDEPKRVPSAQQMEREIKTTEKVKPVVNEGIVKEQSCPRKERTSEDAKKSVLAGQGKLGTAESDVSSVSNTLYLRRDSTYSSDRSCVENENGAKTCIEGITEHRDRQQPIEQQSSAAAGKSILPPKISSDSTLQLTRVSSPSELPDVPLSAPSKKKKSSLSSSASVASTIVTRRHGAAATTTTGRKPVSVRQRMTSSHPPPTRPNSHRLTSKQRPCPSNVSGNSQTHVRGATSKSTSSLPTSALSAASASVAVSSRPLVTQLSPQQPGKATFYTWPGEKGAGGNESEGEGRQSVDRRLVPTAECRTPVGTAAASDPVASPTEQQDAGEKRATERGVSPADIARFSAPMPAFPQSVDDTGVSAGDDSNIDKHVPVMTPKHFNDTLDIFTTPIGSESPDVFSTPLGVCSAQNISNEPCGSECNVAGYESSVTDSIPVYDRSQQNENLNFPGVCRAVPVETFPQTAVSQVGTGFGKACRTERAGERCQSVGVMSSHPSLAAPTPLPAQPAKNSSPVPLPASSLPAWLACSTHRSHVSHSASAGGAAPAYLSLPHHLHYLHPSPHHLLTSHRECRTEGTESGLSQKQPSPGEANTLHSYYSESVGAGLASRRYDVTGSQPGLSPDSCLSPTDSSSEVNSMSARFLMDVCDTQADLTPCRYHSQDTMSSSCSSGEMLFSSAHSIPADVSRSDQRRSSETSHYVPLELVAGAASGLQSARSLDSMATSSRSRLTHRTEHVQFVNSQSLHAVAPRQTVPHTLSSDTIVSSSVSLAPTDHARPAETYTSVFQVSITGQPHHRSDNNACLSDVIYSSSSTSSLTQVSDSDGGSQIMCGQRGDGVLSSSSSVRATAPTERCDLSIPLSHNTPLSVGAKSQSVESFLKSDDSIDTVCQQKASNTGMRAVTDCVTSVSSAKRSTSSTSCNRPTGARKDEIKIRTRVSSKKVISTCVQDLQKITQEEHQSKPGKKAPHPVTLTSVKDSVMKFETTNRSKVALDVRTVNKPGSSVKRSNSVSSPMRSTLTVPDKEKKCVGTKLTRSVSTSRRESGCTERQNAPHSKHSQDNATTTSSSHTSDSTCLSDSKDCVNRNGNTPTLFKSTNSKPDTDASESLSRNSDSEIGNSKFPTADSGIQQKLENISEELLSFQYQAQGISETPSDEGRDGIAFSSAAEKIDKQTVPSYTGGLVSGGLCEEGVIMKKTSEEALGEPGHVVCALSVQSDANSSSVDEFQPGRSAHNQNHVSSERNGETECGGEVPALFRTDKKRIKSHEGGVDDVDTQSSSVPTQRFAIQHSARETLWDLSQECNLDYKHFKHNTKLAEDEARIETSVPSLLSEQTCAAETSETAAHGTAVPVSSAKVGVGIESIEPYGDCNEQNPAAALTAEDCVTLRQKVEQARKTDASPFLPSQPPGESSPLKTQAVSETENFTVGVREGQESEYKQSAVSEHPSPVTVANHVQTGQGVSHTPATTQIEQHLTVTQHGSRLPDKTPPTSTVATTLVETTGSDSAANVGQDSSEGKKTDSDTNVPGKVKPRKISTGASSVCPDSKKPSGQVVKKKNKTSSPPRTNKSTTAVASGTVKREGSVNGKATKDSPVSSVKKPSFLSTESSTSSSPRSQPTRKSSLDKTPSSAKDKNSEHDVLPRGTESRPTGNVRKAAEREECGGKCAETSQTFFGKGGDMSKVNTAQRGEDAETDVYKSSKEHEAEGYNTTRQGIAEGQKLKSTICYKSVSLSGQGNDKPSPDTFTTEIPEENLHRLAKRLPECSEISAAVMNLSDARNTGPSLSHCLLKVGSQRGGKVSSSGQHSDHSSTAKGSEIDEPDFNSTAGRTTDVHWIKHGLSGLQTAVEQCADRRADLEVMETLRGKSVMFEEQRSADDEKQRAQSSRDVIEKERTNENKTEKMKRDEETALLPEDSESSAENGSGQKALAKWKKFVKTSRVTNLKGTFTHKLTTPATRSDSVSPPPAPLSPTPPRKYKWAREGGIWKKIYLSDSIPESEMGNSVTESFTSCPSAIDGIESAYSGGASFASDDDYKREGDKLKEDTDDDDRDAPIDFPSVLAMSKRFEQESEKQILDHKPRVTCRKVSENSVNQNESSVSGGAQCQDFLSKAFSSCVAKTTVSSDRTSVMTGDSVCGHADRHSISVSSVSDIPPDTDSKGLVAHRHPYSSTRLANPPVESHQDCRFGGQSTIFPATKSTSVKPSLYPHCADQRDSQLSDQASPNTSTCLQMGGGHQKRESRVLGSNTESGKIDTHDGQVEQGRVDVPVLFLGNNNCADQIRTADNNRLQTTLAGKTAVSCDVPYLPAGTDSHDPAPTMLSSSRVSNFAFSPQTVRREGRVEAETKIGGKPETTRAEMSARKTVIVESGGSAIAAVVDTDVKVKQGGGKGCYTMQQLWHRQGQPTVATSVADVSIQSNTLYSTTTLSSTATSLQTAETTTTSTDQTPAGFQSSRQSHKPDASFFSPDEQNDGKRSVQNTDSAAAAGKTEAARDRDRSDSPRKEMKNELESISTRHDNGLHQHQHQAAPVPAPKSICAPSKTKQNDPFTKEPVENIKQESTSKSAGSRSPVPTRLSEGLKRLQKSRGTPWGQQYIQRGDSMAASNWRLLVSRVTDTAAEEEDVSGGKGPCTPTVDDNVKETKALLSDGRLKEAVVPTKEVSSSGSVVLAERVSDAVTENITTAKHAYGDTTTSASDINDTSSDGCGIQPSPSQLKQRTNLDQMPEKVLSDTRETVGSEKDSYADVFIMKQTDTSVGSDLDTSDTRIETTFSDTVFESRIPANTPTNTPRRSSTPRQRRNTPERNTLVSDQSAKDNITPPFLSDREKANKSHRPTSNELSESCLDGYNDSMNTSSSSSSSSSTTTSSKLKRQIAKSNIIDIDNFDDDTVDERTSYPASSTLDKERGSHTGVLSSSDPHTSSSSPQRSSRGGVSAKLISVTVWDTHDGDKALRSGARRVFWDLDCKELLAGISEQEEQGCSQEEPHLPKATHTPHVSRSLQATPEKHRDGSRERDGSAGHPRRRRNTRRSLSLPTGSLSYGDVRISYRDGHFVTEAIGDGGGGGGGCADQAVRKGRAQGDRSRSDSDAAVLCGSLMNISSQEEMREEILSLLERGFSTDDITLLFSRYLDQNSNHLSESAPSQSTQSLNAANLYQTQSLPRSRRNCGSLSRPVSVDNVNLCQQFSQSEQNLLREETEKSSDMNRRESFYRAMSTSVVPGKEMEDGVVFRTRLHRHNSDEARTDRLRSQRPGFIQRMLQKRKSFHDKPNANGRAPKEDNAGSSRKDAREPVARKVSIKGIFKRKNSTSSIESKKDLEEPSSPPIATFMNDDDIGAISCMPASPTSGVGRRTQSYSQLGNIGECGRSASCSDCDQVDASVLRRPRLPLPGEGGVKRVSERFSGEYIYCELDTSSECRSSQDTLTPRSTSPSNASTLTLEGDPSSTFRISEEEEEEEETDALESDLSTLNSSWDGEATILASPRSLDRTQVSVSDRTPVNSVGHPQRSARKPSVPKQDLDKLAAIVQGEITSSNSNDSGIQHDVAVGSSESLKIPADLATQLTSAVKLRNSPSPKQERPKSDFTVRWADLLEQVREADGIYRRDGARLRKRPRPKSDLAEDSGEDEGLDYDSTSSEEGGSSILVDQSSRTLGGALGALALGSLGGGGGSGLHLPGGQQYDSFLDLVELRRPANRGRLDTAALQAAKLAKSRRMSTPHPIKTRADKVVPKSPKRVCLVRSHSMPDNLDRLHRKKNYFSLIGGDIQSEYSQISGGEDSSDESELSMDYQQEKSLSTRASRVTLATLDQLIEEENLTYAEALWDHVTMDPDELGFRAGDLIRVTDTGDKHWWYGATQHRDGWFPAAFVRLRVNQDDLEAEMTLRVLEEEEEQTFQQRLSSLPSSSQLTTKTSPAGCSSSDKTQLRANVVNEIITAETEYVGHLRDVIEGYLKQAKKRPEMFPAEKVAVIFSNIEVIYDFATKLLAELQDAVNKEQPHLTEFGHCFLDKTPQFEIYSEYCNNHPDACEEVHEMYRVKRYRHFFEACRLLQEMTEIPLEGFLLTPVQKICKYHLQLAELLKYTPEDHPDYPHVQSAVKAMKHIAKLVNERKRKMESIETLTEWQMTVDDWEGPDVLDDSSELIHSGDINKINANGWSQERTFFLFDHQLVYCKKDLLKKNSFVYKGRIWMDNTEVSSVTDGRDTQYNVTVRNAFKLHDKDRNKWYLLVAKSPEQKQNWLKAFSAERQRVKEDMENNFNIPQHLKLNIISNLKQKSGTKSKGKRKLSRSNSYRSSKNDAWTSANATLPRIPKKAARGSVQGSSSQQSSRIMNFLLGGKKK